MKKVVHFEIPVDDMERAKEFYKIFDWDLEDVPEMDYVCVRTVDVDENHAPTEAGAINGGMMKRTADIQAPIVAIHVDCVASYIEKVEAAGGEVVMPKKEIFGVGYYAYVKDTEGNIVGLWEPTDHEHDHDHNCC